MSQKSPNKDTVVKDAIIAVYLNIIENKVNMFPTRVDLLNAGISRDQIRHHFGNLLGLRKAAKEANPELFSGVVNPNDPSLNTESLSKKIKKFKRFFITTAVNGQWVHEGFLKSINKFCKDQKALLLLLPSHDPAHNLDNEVEWHFDDKIADYDVVFDKLEFNSNVHISSIRVTAKQVSPTVGLSRFIQGEGSAIFGSPKQSLEYIPVSNVKYPHALISTGAITSPNYSSTRGNSLRSAFIAHHDHIIGGIIVEVQDDKIYHFRQVQAAEDGSFCDLGKQYSAEKITKVAPTAFVLGDYHAGQHDPSAVKAWEEVAKVTGAKTVVLHDMFNGQSINHHEQHNIIKRAQHSKENKLSLKRELEVTGEEFNRMLKAFKEVVVVKSNHDEFLIRWLQEAKFRDDPVNFQIGCDLANATVDGIDPLIAGIVKYGKVRDFARITWLNRDEDYKIAGIELGAHGDKGPNGSRGSKANLEKAYGKAVIGHSHTPGILRGIWQVGTTSLFDLDYNVGASSWLHCSCLVYENGQRQLINSIEGDWRLK